MECTWEVSFKSSRNPEAAAKAFFDKIDGCGIWIDDGPEIELWAFLDENDSGQVIVGNHDIDLQASEIHAIVDEFIEETKKECARTE